MRGPGILLLLASRAAAQDLNEEWFRADVAVVARLAGALPPRDLTAAEFLGRLDPTDTREDREVFPGARRIRVEVGGGYCSCAATALVKEDRIVGISCYLDESLLLRLLEVDEVPREKVEARLLAPWKGTEWRREREGLSWRWADAARKARFEEAVAKAFGAPEPVRAQGRLRDSYALLRSPFARFEYGWTVGEGGDTPRGRVAIERLLAAGRFDLIRNVARGPNPEARAYAADALLRAARKGRRLSPAEEKLVAAVRATKVPIVCADGCLISEKLPAAAIDDCLADE